MVSLCPECEAAKPIEAPLEKSAGYEYETLVKELYVSKDFEHAGFWLRVCSALIDGAILYILFLIISFFLFALVGGLLLISPIIGIMYPIIAGLLAYLLTVIFAGFILPSVLESSQLQGTFGKYLIGLRVTNESGTRIGLLKALLRSFIRTIFPIGCITAAFTENKQTVHDMLSSTLVVKYKKVHPLNIFIYVLVSLIITYGIAYYTRDKKNPSPWAKSANPLSKFENKMDGMLDKFEMQVKSQPTIANLPVVTPPPSEQTSIASPTQKPVATPTPKIEIDRSTLSEFDRRVLEARELREAQAKSHK